jgi:hypothetical protein
LLTGKERHNDPTTKQRKEPQMSTPARSNRARIKAAIQRHREEQNQPPTEAASQPPQPAATVQKPAVAKPAKQKPSTLPRLPAGARFDVQYSEDPEPTWTGYLEVPSPDGGMVKFEGTSGAVFRLLTQLDTQYRRWQLEQNSQPQRAEPDAHGDD